MLCLLSCCARAVFAVVLCPTGAAGGYGPTGLGEAQLAELLAAVEARMAALGADVTVLRQRKVGEDDEGRRKRGGSWSWRSGAPLKMPVHCRPCIGGFLDPPALALTGLNFLRLCSCRRPPPARRRRMLPTCASGGVAAPAAARPWRFVWPSLAT